jgi:hypothetical protein
MKFLILISLFILTSCSSVKKGPKFSLENNEKDNGVVYFYRPSGDWATMRSPEVYVDQVKSFRAANLGFKKIILSPGLHSLEVKGYELGNPDVTFRVKPGKIYYLRMSFRSNSNSVYHFGKTAYPKIAISSYNDLKDYQEEDVTETPFDSRLYFVKPLIGVQDITQTNEILDH